VEGVGVFPDLNIPAQATATATGNAGFGPQAGPVAISSFMAATSTSGLAGPTTAAHPSFTVGPWRLAVVPRRSSPTTAVRHQHL
jgi:hypothetical protein